MMQMAQGLIRFFMDPACVASLLLYSSRKFKKLKIYIHVKVQKTKEHNSHTNNT